MCNNDVPLSFYNVALVKSKGYYILWRYVTYEVGLYCCIYMLLYMYRGWQYL